MTMGGLWQSTPVAIGTLTERLRDPSVSLTQYAGTLNEFSDKVLRKNGHLKSFAERCVDPLCSPLVRAIAGSVSNDSGLLTKSQLLINFVIAAYGRTTLAQPPTSRIAEVLLALEDGGVHDAIQNSAYSKIDERARPSSAFIRWDTRRVMNVVQDLELLGLREILRGNDTGASVLPTEIIDVVRRAYRLPELDLVVESIDQGQEGRIQLAHARVVRSRLVRQSIHLDERIFASDAPLTVLPAIVGSILHEIRHIAQMQMHVPKTLTSDLNLFQVSLLSHRETDDSVVYARSLRERDANEFVDAVLAGLGFDHRVERRKLETILIAKCRPVVTATDLDLKAIELIARDEPRAIPADREKTSVPELFEVGTEESVEVERARREIDRAIMAGGLRDTPRNAEDEFSKLPTSFLVRNLDVDNITVVGPILIARMESGFFGERPATQLRERLTERALCESDIGRRMSVKLAELPISGSSQNLDQDGVAKEILSGARDAEISKRRATRDTIDEIGYRLLAELSKTHPDWTIVATELRRLELKFAEGFVGELPRKAFANIVPETLARLEAHARGEPLGERF